MPVGIRSRLHTCAVTALFAASLSAAFACATGVRRVEDGFENSRRGYRIDAPSGSETWQRVKVKDVDLSFSDDSGEVSMSLFSHCGSAARQLADAPEWLARQLLFGLRPATPPLREEIEILGRPGVAQIFHAEEASRRIAVKTVSFSVEGCGYDFALVAARRFAEREAAFDRWWSSFSLNPPSQGGGG